jgi:hypothetical protein
VKLKTKKLKRVKGNIQGKHLRKKTLKKGSISVDSSENEHQEIPYAELSNGVYLEVSEKKEIANVTKQSFAFGDDAKGAFILVKLARKRSISHYAAEVMKDFHGHEYEISYYRHLENTSRFYP